MAVNKSGNLLLIANRADSSVSVLTIKGQEVKLVDSVAMGDPVSAVAFTPDGKHAVVAKNTVNKVSLLNIDGEKVTYDKTDLSVGVYPYNVQVTADGRFALTVEPGQWRSAGWRGGLGHRHRSQGDASPCRRLCRHQAPCRKAST